ncbi:DALR anticodon-binding domain-containing protein 3 [Exaiptasia diaphana]|nr:DALR anticodon-binding domain-containing protein 3 [Exaiptasia diaphana]
MAASQNSQVKIDVSDKSQDFRQATFIMYNCARLAKLFHHYEESVQQGHYPPLPQIDEVDFSLLREKDEWKLLVCYVMQYPAVVRDALNDLLSPTHDSIVTVNINKMCCFLLDLCKDFSSYYGRTHVLGEPRPHLFPSMFARLYLLKAIQQVFHNCLALMDIQPLTQM